MYKLAYFYASNIIGFVSGLGKTVEIDFTDGKHGSLLDKDIVVILGDNATGKSTFLSLIHPLHTPSDDRHKFVVPGKEGILIRTYHGEDGSKIVTKCVYKPKADESGHMPKCFFAYQRPGEKKPQEYNESGNVSTYMNLIRDYFQITKEYVNFASYSDAVDGIVTMTSTERKNSVATLIPNTARFEIAYNTVNEKYKELRNMIRNISQKILALRDEDTLTAELDRINRQLDQANADRDEYIRKFAKAEGRVKELSQGKDIQQMVAERDQKARELQTIDQSYGIHAHQVIAALKELQEEIPDHITDPSQFPMLSAKLQKYERKVAQAESTLETTKSRLEQVWKSLDAAYQEQNDMEARVVSIQTTDLDELMKTKMGYEADLAGMRYSRHQELYEHMSYPEITAFMQSVSMMDRMIQALYDSYGAWVSDYFKHGDFKKRDYSQENEKLQVSILTNSKRRDAVYQSLIAKNQYSELRKILEKRPAACKIDTCPFIVNALKWNAIAGEIEQLKQECQELDLTIAADEKSLKENQERYEMYEAADRFRQFAASQEVLLRKYLGLELEDLYKAVANTTWTKKLDLVRLKTTAAILSEKDLFVKITTKLLPEVNHAIEIAKLYGSNQEMVQAQLKRIARSIRDLTEEKKQLEEQQRAVNSQKEIYKRKLQLWREIQEGLTKIQELTRRRLAQYEQVDQLAKSIDTIGEIVDKCRKYQAKIYDLAELINNLIPLKQQTFVDLNNLLELKREKLDVERDFIIVDVMKSIIQPGKGIRKELINIYMYDIYQTANQLLLNTFDGKLYLKEFIITDKEFVIPYVYNGTEGNDISYASSSQQSTISMALSLAIISKMIDKYGVLGVDEADRTLSPENKAVFVEILMEQIKMIGIRQTFIITHSYEYYEGHDCGILAFPGAKFNKKEATYIKV